MREKSTSHSRVAAIGVIAAAGDEIVVACAAAEDIVGLVADEIVVARAADDLLDADQRVAMDAIAIDQAFALVLQLDAQRP